MTDLTVTFNTVSLPAGTSGTITVYEDQTGDGTSDFSDSVALSNGTTEYTLTGYQGGNDVWPEVSLDNTDVTQTASAVELLNVSIDTIVVTESSVFTQSTGNLSTTESAITTESSQTDVSGLTIGSSEIGITTVSSYLDTTGTPLTASEAIPVPEQSEITIDSNSFTTESGVASESGQTLVLSTTLDADEVARAIELATLADAYVETTVADEQETTIETGITESTATMLEAILTPLGRIGIFGGGDSTIENRQV